ncbi:MAG: alginate lyase family protein [Amaricoccus sp.]|uniref:alginate lyase family protein n=1 Tax=Amaricoccus sp. TaxID=1872485 RepID=UPI0039E224A3
MPPLRQLLLGLATLAAGCAAGPSEPTIFSPAGITHPEALFDVTTRSAQIRSYSAGTGAMKGTRYCLRESDAPALAPLVGPSLAAVKAGGDSNNAARDMARALNATAFRVLLENDAEAARQAVAVLRQHADANAWIVAKPSWTNAAGVINAFPALLPAWQVLRQTPAATPDDKAAIEAWLTRLTAQADEHPGDNNLGTARGAADMLLGLMLGDPARYQRGVQTGFIAQLQAMRPDGSFPLETDRGLGALQNQSRNIAFLLYSAEIAASQGENLYGTKVDGKSVDDAIRFLLAAADDNALVDGYAATNRNPPKTEPAFRPGAQLDPFDSTSRGWAVLYTEHFPRSELSDEIRAHIKIGSRVNADAVGGNVTCYAKRL